MFWVRGIGVDKQFRVYSAFVDNFDGDTWFLMWSESKGWVWLNAKHFVPAD